MCGKVLCLVNFSQTDVRLELHLYEPAFQSHGADLLQRLLEGLNECSFPCSLAVSLINCSGPGVAEKVAILAGSLQH